MLDVNILISVVTVNEDDVGEYRAITLPKLVALQIRNLNLTAFFSKTVMDRQKLFSLMETTFQVKDTL